MEQKGSTVAIAKPKTKVFSSNFQSSKVNIFSKPVTGLLIKTTTNFPTDSDYFPTDIYKVFITSNTITA